MKTEEEQQGQNGRAHLQQQGVDADDARLWDGWQEIVFYSEGKVRMGSVRSRTSDLRRITVVTRRPLTSCSVG